MGWQAELQTQEHRDLLDIIDKLRSHGVGQVVDLPEIVVCGDQSAGKSSVLEAISGLSFPKREGLCTCFVTELVLRRSPAKAFKVSIIPGPDTSDACNERLRTFGDSVKVEDYKNGKGLGSVIERAKEAMGVSNTKKFSTSTLRVEISGPDQSHLTLVDLPGLYRAGNRDQAAENAKTVRKMVCDRIRRPRSIILAVVSANGDSFNNQEITELARKYDPGLLRTLGLITKPDKLDAGSEKEQNYLQLAQNRDVFMYLGWHVLRNPDWDEAGSSMLKRDQDERGFFSQGVWSTMSPSHLGIASLRKRLSVVLKDLILQHLPDLIQEVAKRKKEHDDLLSKLGDPRGNDAEQRRYLLAVSETFTTLMRAAVEGNYGAAFFVEANTQQGYQRRLRAVVQNTLEEFGKTMWETGKAEILIEDHYLQLAEVAVAPPSSASTENGSARPQPETPRTLRKDYLSKVSELMQRSRGRELPGTFNPLIITDLFWEQSRPWSGITNEVKDSIMDAVKRTTMAILNHVALDKTVRGIHGILFESIERLRGKLEEQIHALLKPHDTGGHPITYNHYLTTMVQQRVSNRLRTKFRREMATTSKVDDKWGQQTITLQNVTAMLDRLATAETDMALHASSLAVDYAESYYKVALKKYIDEISIQAVEYSLIRELPLLFTPEKVYDMSNKEIRRLAADDEQTIADRERSSRLVADLNEDLATLRRLERQQRIVPSAAPPEPSLSDESEEVLEEAYPIECPNGAREVDSSDDEIRF